jgi:hypothetical protein
MQTISPGDLLTITIALSAYLATVRMFILQRLVALPEVELLDATESKKVKARKQELKKLLRLIAIADIPLILTVLLVCSYAFWPDLTGIAASIYVAKAAIVCFLVGIAILATYHIGEWKKSFKRIIH